MFDMALESSPLVIYSLLGVIGLLLLAISTSLIGFWYYRKSTINPVAEPELKKEKVKLTAGQPKFPLYNQEHVHKTKNIKLNVVSKLPKCSGDTAHMKDLAQLFEVASMGDNNSNNLCLILHGEKNSNEQERDDIVSNDVNAKSSTPRVKEASCSKSLVERYFDKKLSVSSCDFERVSDAGDTTPASFVESITVPFTEDRPFVVAYADLVSMRRPQPYPITEETSNLLSSQNYESSSSNNDPLYVFQKKSKKSTSDSSYTYRVQKSNNKLTTSPSRKDRRSQKIMTHTQKEVQDAKKVKASFNKKHLTRESSCSPMSDESASFSIETQDEYNSKVSVRSAGGNNSGYFSEFSVTISPGDEMELVRETVSKKKSGEITKSNSTNAREPKQFVDANIYGDSDQGGGTEGSEGVGESGDDRGELSLQLPTSPDEDNDKTPVAKASKKVIVSVAFATCTESNQAYREHYGLTSGTPDEQSRSLSVGDEKTEEFLICAPFKLHTRTTTKTDDMYHHQSTRRSNVEETTTEQQNNIEEAIEDVEIKSIDMKETGSSPESIVTRDGSRNTNNNKMGGSSDNETSLRLLSKRHFEYCKHPNTSSSENEFAYEKEEAPLAIGKPSSNLRQTSTEDTEVEHENSVRLISRTKLDRESNPYLGYAGDVDKSRSGSN